MQIDSQPIHNSLTFTGIPDNIPQKDLEPVVIQLLASIGVQVTSYDISTCHRLKNNTNNKKTAANVIVRFVKGSTFSPKVTIEFGLRLKFWLTYYYLKSFIFYFLIE